MIGYIFKRLLATIPMMIGITLITYLFIFLTPGGPAAGIMSDLNPKVSSDYKGKLIKEYNFDKPFYVQYGLWISKVVRLDFGTSLNDNRPVAAKIWERIPKTLLLTISSLILSFLLAMPLGILSALKQNTWVDRSITVFVFLGLAIPTYWVALLLMILFGIQLGWFPVTGYESIFADELGPIARVFDVAKHLALPLMVTALTGLTTISRYMRSGMLEVIQQDYIRTARAKGLPESKVIGVHALRNTLIPVVTILGLSLPELIGASVIFETIFSYPGFGRLAYEAVMTRDIALIMGIATVGAFLTLLGNLIADVSYALVDPRIRHR